MNRPATFIAMVLLIAFTVTIGCFAGMREDVRFHLSMRTGGNEVEFAFDHVGRSRDKVSNSMPIADLQHLSPTALSAPDRTPATFTIDRTPGRLDCRGAAGQGGADGRCDFTRNAAFDASLARVGYPRLDDDQQFVLTVTDFDPAVIDALRAGGYRAPDASDLIALGIFSIHADYVRDVAAAGYRPGSVRDLVQFRIARVTPALIAAYRRLNSREASARDITGMGIQGVTPAFIDGFARAGFRNISADKLIQLKIFGITPDDVRAMRGRGYADITPDMLIRSRILAGAMKG